MTKWIPAYVVVFVYGSVYLPRADYVDITLFVMPFCVAFFLRDVIGAHND